MKKLHNPNVPFLVIPASTYEQAYRLYAMIQELLELSMASKTKGRVAITMTGQKVTVIGVVTHVMYWENTGFEPFVRVNYAYPPEIEPYENHHES